MEILRTGPQFDLEEFLARPLIAHLSSHAPGGPRHSPSWYHWTRGAFWIVACARENHFQLRVAGDPRCSLGIVDYDARAGRLQHAGVRGRGTIAAFDRELVTAMYARYVGPETSRWHASVQERYHDPHNLLVRIEPETVVLRDHSYVPPFGMVDSEPHPDWATELPGGGGVSAG